MVFNPDGLFGGDLLASPVTTPAGSLGRFQAGDRVPLAVDCVDGTALPVVPDAAPAATVTDPGSATFAVVALARNGPATSFSLPLSLGLAPSLGRYTVSYAFAYGGGAHSGSASATFDVIEGGDPGGAVISMFSIDRPEATYVVAQLDSGRLVQGRNPLL